MNGRDWLNNRLQQLKLDPQLSTTIVERIERPKLDPKLFRREKRGKVGYALRPDGTRVRTVARGDGSTVFLEPGTKEFHDRYTPPGEKVIERFTPDGPEGWKWTRCDGVTGEPLGD